MKRLLLLTFIFVFAINAVGFAAVGGSKVRMSSPRPSTQQAAPPPASNYKPSAPASSYTEKAPAAKAATPQASQPATGGFMRNFGMFGGGMLLGSLLGNMFGFGHTGMFANMMGMLFNVLLLAAIFMAGRFVWNKMTNRDRNDRR
ncbi:hypothetical protein AXX12_00755 [Anaerosporomusa subterranea]|uniref:Preprotein translocase subunit Tim44 n=1 Tax=Anaerosporomusa subterranea TaxID=1794912 RepID=A0A154BVZ4_ANASB|nr:hypothetical protein [Anaerosporomusa subterranea]KYZ78109.1 hypothetical protein AXX12_00755 [Anaerosporomusa subterranea]